MHVLRSALPPPAPPPQALAVVLEAARERLEATAARLARLQLHTTPCERLPGPLPGGLTCLELSCAFGLARLQALPDALPPLESVAVTAQAIASRDAAEALESESVAPAPRRRRISARRSESS